MRNLLLKISYDGKYYHGWQIQQNAVTVQEVFQDALKNILGIQQGYPLLLWNIFLELC